MFGKEHMKVPFTMQEINIYKLVIQWGQYLACFLMANAQGIMELFGLARVRPDEIHLAKYQSLLENTAVTLNSAYASNQFFIDYKGAGPAWWLTFHLQCSKMNSLFYTLSNFQYHGFFSLLSKWFNAFTHLVIFHEADDLSNFWFSILWSKHPQPLPFSVLWIQNITDADLFCIFSCSPLYLIFYIMLVLMAVRLLS